MVEGDVQEPKEASKKRVSLQAISSGIALQEFSCTVYSGRQHNLVKEASMDEMSAVDGAESLALLRMTLSGRLHWDNP